MNGESGTIAFGVALAFAGALAAEWVEAVGDSHTLGTVVALDIVYKIQRPQGGG